MENTALIVFIVIGLPIICFTVIYLTRIIIKQGNQNKKRHQEDDIEVIEKIYHGLKDLDDRVENLETILFKQHRE